MKEMICRWNSGKFFIDWWQVGKEHSGQLFWMNRHDFTSEICFLIFCVSQYSRRSLPSIYWDSNLILIDTCSSFIKHVRLSSNLYINDLDKKIRFYTFVFICFFWNSAKVVGRWKGVYRFIYPGKGIIVPLFSDALLLQATNVTSNLILWSSRNFALWRCFNFECGWAGQVV